MSLNPSKGKTIGERFGEVLGGGWRLLASCRPLFGVVFGCLYLECSLEGLVESPGRDFEGFGRGLGRVWGAKVRVF